MRVPVLRAEEAMMEQAVTLGERILLVCTAKRAMPVVRGTLDAAVEARRRHASDHASCGSRAPATPSPAATLRRTTG